MIRIEFIFSRFESILLGASGEGFRKQTKEGKSLFTLRGLVCCDAKKTSSELPLYKTHYFESDTRCFMQVSYNFPIVC